MTPEPLHDLLMPGDLVRVPGGQAGSEPTLLPSEVALTRALERLHRHLEVAGLGVVIVGRSGEAVVAVSGERALGTGVALERDDPWHLGSNGKVMTAVLAARLVQEGRAAWDDSIGRVLRDHVEEIASEWDQATLTHLLTHCSGLPPTASRLTMVRLVGDDSRDASADRLRYAENVLTSEPDARPGTAVAYSNAGYVVAGAMLEARTGTAWEVLMRGQVFEPLGLTTAGIGPPGSEDEVDTPRGHRAGWFGFGGPRPVAPDFAADNPPALGPAGRIHMSLNDYGAILADQLRGPLGEGILLSAEMYRRLQTPGCDPSMAAGWGVTPEGHLRHAGSNTMWYAEAVVWPLLGSAMAVVSNDGRVERQRASVLSFMEQVHDLLEDTAAGGPGASTKP